jgi:hypothetical protein
LFSFAAFGQSTGNVSQTATNYFPLPKVDKRIELLSIVFRLAGNMEYNDEIFRSYTSDIHMHFDKNKDHELIRFAQEIRDKNWIGFDAVMKMAIYLEQTSTLNPIVPFTDDVPDRRWGKGNANKFLKLLQQFYTDAKCDDFFNAHKDLYRLSEERYKNVYESILNPIMDNFNKQIDQIPLKYSTADPSKITFLCESFLRSFTAYFLIKNQYDEFAQMVMQGEKQQGYIYNELIVDLINDYANNRNIYKAFNDYIPVFLDKLKQEVENK